MSTLKVDTLQHRDGTEYILSERNKVINGDFQVAQRGTSLTSTDSANDDAKYTLDRWQLFSDGNDVVDVSQETTTVPTNQLYAIALDVETANKKFGIAQKDVPSGRPYKIVDVSEVPTDRTFRNAWEYQA